VEPEKAPLIVLWILYPFLCQNCHVLHVVNVTSQHKQRLDLAFSLGFAMHFQLYRNFVNFACFIETAEFPDSSH